MLGPAELQGPFDSNGVAVGCNSACAAGLGDPSTYASPLSFHHL